MIQIRRNVLWVWFVLAACAAGLGGCNVLDPLMGAYAPLQIQSVEKKDKVIQPAFSDVVYYPDRDRVVHVISTAEGTDAATGKPVRQILILRIFWIPVGGKTSMNPTSLNFTFRYLVIAADAAAQYEGAGFARLNDEPDADQLPIRIVDADLRMTEKTEKFVDVLQRCRVAGNITARRDDHETVARLLAAEREYFHATLEISQASTRPATSSTAPATRPMPEIKFFDGATTTPTTLPATAPATEPDRAGGMEK
jgi:hypothetical protein